MLDVTEIKETAQLEALEPEWRALWENWPDATPFQHPGWLIPWWKHFGSGQLQTLALRRQGKLIGVAPLFLHEWQGRTQVTILGTGISDYLDLLCHTESMDAVFAHLRNWEVCDWQDLSNRFVVPETLSGTWETSEPCLYIALPSQTDEVIGLLKQGLRRNVQRYRRQLEEQGELVFERSSDRGLLATLFELHTRQWNAKGQTGVLASPQLFEFHQEVTNNLRAMLRFYVLRFDGKAIGVNYGYRWKHTYYSYLVGFDPDFHRYSVGSLLLHRCILATVDDGAQTWDFLRGEEPYKLHWSGRPRPKYRLRMSPVPGGL